MRKLEANLSKGETRRATLDGRACIVVPVIMARGDVVMNATLVPPAEFEAFAWNGVPVTLGHPSAGGSFLSANRPEMLTQYRVGVILNANVTDGQLRGEAWIDVELANKKAPGLIAQLEGGVEMDVSTGFFSDLEAKAGHLNGRDYEGIHHNIRPDHLALLPNEVGACSYADGCGVRSNIREALSANFMKALAVVSAELSKWQPAGPGADLVLRAQKASEDGKGAEPEPHVNKEAAMTKEEIAALVANTVKETVGQAVSAALANHKAELSAEDKALLAFAKAQADAERAALVEKITANSAITKAQAEAMDLATLKVVANGLPTKAAEVDYSGRGIPAAVAVNASDEQKIAAMMPKGIVAHFAAKKKEAA